MRIPHDALVLVADGRKMLFLRNHGDEAQIDLRTEAHGAREDRKDGEIKTDAPGRAYASAGTAVSAMDETDFHQQEEDRFAAAAAEQLKKRALDGDFEALLIVAPPRTLGELRKRYHKEVSARLIGEFDKEMTDRPIPDIEALLIGNSAPPSRD